MKFRALISSVVLVALPMFTNASVINFEGTLQDYVPQAQGGTTTLAADKQSISMSENIWSSFAGTFEITPDTIIAIDFKSESVGEIHGIGFDTKNWFGGTRNSGTFFQFAGTQAYGNQAFNNYANDGEWRTYTIAVGQFFTGTFSHLVFINDADNVTGITSQFRLTSDIQASNVNEAPLLILMTGLFGALILKSSRKVS